MAELKSITPYLQAGPDFDAGIAFYCDVLGFQMRYRDAQMAIVQRDDVEIFLQNYHKLELAEWTVIRLAAQDIRALHTEYSQKGILPFHDDPSQPGITALEEMPWGTTEFSIRDCAGTCLQFYEKRPAHD
jgi:catechol 2,3-dioxygenase-like lactoylglutathione lyase family enzyme